MSIRNPPEPKPPSTDSKRRPAHRRARRGHRLPGRPPAALTQSGIAKSKLTWKEPPRRGPQVPTRTGTQSPPAACPPVSQRARVSPTVPGRPAARSPPRAPPAAARSPPRAPTPARCSRRRRALHPHPPPTHRAPASARCTALPRAPRAPQNTQRAGWAFKGTGAPARRCCPEAASRGARGSSVSARGLNWGPLRVTPAAKSSRGLRLELRRRLVSPAASSSALRAYVLFSDNNSEV